MFTFQETLFCSILVVCNLATGISCAVLAGEWGKTPTSCIDAELHDACDSKLLSTTNAMQAVLHYYCAKLVLLCSRSFYRCSASFKL